MDKYKKMTDQTSPKRDYKGVLKNWWQDPELNRGHKDFQSSALPTELSCQPEPPIELGFAFDGKTGIH